MSIVFGSRTYMTPEEYLEALDTLYSLADLAVEEGFSPDVFLETAETVCEGFARRFSV